MPGLDFLAERSEHGCCPPLNSRPGGALTVRMIVVDGALPGPIGAHSAAGLAGFAAAARPPADLDPGIAQREPDLGRQRRVVLAEVDDQVAQAWAGHWPSSPSTGRWQPSRSTAYQPCYHDDGSATTGGRPPVASPWRLMIAAAASGGHAPGEREAPSRPRCA